MYYRLKNFGRDLLPMKYQVPVKYNYHAFRGSLERELDIIRFLISPSDLVLDIGGNRGIYAYHFWKLGADVEVFEPNLNCSAVLSAWAERKPNVNIHAVALSNRAGTAELHIPVDASGIEHEAAASIENTKLGNTRRLSVPLQTLDSRQFRQVALIKIDVEGHEYSVIEGAEATIAASKPALLIEIEQRHNAKPIGEVFAKILDLGYQGYFMLAGQLKPLERFDAGQHQSLDNFRASNQGYINNFLFLHQDKLAEGWYGNLLNGRLSK